MTENRPSPIEKVTTIDHDRIERHLDWVVRGEETEADRLCNPPYRDLTAVLPLRKPATAS